VTRAGLCIHLTAPLEGAIDERTVTVNPETATRFFDFAERHGFALHEVHAGDKAPIGADWQHRYSRDLATWQGWLIGGRNIGLHPGRRKSRCSTSKPASKKSPKSGF